MKDLFSAIYSGMETGEMAVTRCSCIRRRARSSYENEREEEKKTSKARLEAVRLMDLRKHQEVPVKDEGKLQKHSMRSRISKKSAKDLHGISRFRAR